MLLKINWYETLLLLQSLFVTLCRRTSDSLLALDVQACSLRCVLTSTSVAALWTACSVVQKQAAITEEQMGSTGIEQRYGVIKA